MLVVAGHFDSQGSPALKIRIAAPGAQDGHEVTAILDTGFTGFFSMPSATAARLGLKPGSATTEVELADGSVGTRPLAEGAAILGDRRVNGPVILEEISNDILAGMDFLRTFNLLLLVGSQGVVLIHETELMESVLQATKRRRPQLVLPLGPPEILSPPSGKKE